MNTRLSQWGAGWLAALMAIGVTAVQGQQLFRYTQYMVNPFLSNPAVAGTTPYSPIQATFRNQWAGFKDGPRTQVLSGHTALPNRIGVGGMFYSDNTGGAIRQTGVEIAGSYTVDLNNFDAVSFGLGIMANQWSFDNAGLEVWDVEGVDGEYSPVQLPLSLTEGTPSSSKLWRVIMAFAPCCAIRSSTATN